MLAVTKAMISKISTTPLDQCSHQVALVPAANSAWGTLAWGLGNTVLAWEASSLGDPILA
jgi:hypothetical protein